MRRRDFLGLLGLAAMPKLTPAEWLAKIPPEIMPVTIGEGARLITMRGLVPGSTVGLFLGHDEETGECSEPLFVGRVDSDELQVSTDAPPGTPVIVRVRKVKYVPFETRADVVDAGLEVTPIQVDDPIYGVGKEMAWEAEEWRERYQREVR